MSLLTVHHRRRCGRRCCSSSRCSRSRCPPPSPEVSAPPHDCIRGNELSFTTTDGVRLAGHRFGGLRPGARPAVVLAHQSNGSICEWLPEARRLAARGIWVLAFDFRGHGLSKGRVHYGRLATDYAAAVKLARSLGARNVVLAGASLGGIAAVVAGAAIRPPVAGIAALSAPAVIAGRVDARPFAPRLAVPALYVAARGDQSPPYDFAADAQRLYDATRLDGEAPRARRRVGPRGRARRADRPRSARCSSASSAIRPPPSAADAALRLLGVPQALEPVQDQVEPELELGLLLRVRAAAGAAARARSGRGTPRSRFAGGTPRRGRRVPRASRRACSRPRA